MDQQTKKKFGLIIIDLQNDFLEDNHFTDKRKGDMQFNRSILPHINSMCKAFREKSYPVIWIHSVYGEVEESQQCLPPNFFNPSDELIKGVPLNNELLSGTHKQGELSCCKRNTTGIEFYKDVLMMQDKEKDQFIQKQYYSAFRKTNLYNYLKENQITDVVVCGVATNYCCRASSVDAYHLGFNVIMLSDCVAASSTKNHLAALESLRLTQIEITNSLNFLELLG